MMEWYFDTFGCRNVICDFAIKFLIFVYICIYIKEKVYSLYIASIKIIFMNNVQKYILILKLNMIFAQSNKIKLRIIIFKLRPIP